MNLAKEFEKYASSDAFFYVALDPERALGLEDILPNYCIICPYSSILTDKLRGQGVEVVILEEHTKSKELAEIVRRGTYGILQWLAARGLKAGTVPAQKQGQSLLLTPHILVLKNSALIESLCKKQGWHLLAPKARIVERYENKISQYKVLKNIVPYPKTTISTVEDIAGTVPAISFGDSPGKILEKVVLQFNRGHSGNSTYFIKSKKDLIKLSKLYPRREVKVSEYVSGKTYTLNCLVLSGGGIVTGSLNEQITGLESATNNPNTTCGNDFGSVGKLSRKIVNNIKEIAESTGGSLYRRGYKGLFGIDVIIGRTSNEVYFIELNTHQPASIPFETKLHIKIGKVPLLAYFILDSLGNVGDRKFQKPSMILPILAKQIIFRNKRAKILYRRSVEKNYSNKGLVSRMKFIKPNEEIYRKQFT